MSALENRYEFTLLFDVENGNPNGDPDAGNMPRMDPETSIGLISDVCMKRKIRNYISLAKGEEQGWNIYVQESSVLSENRQGAYDSEDVSKIKDKKEKTLKARDWMCRNFFDVRAFGAVMSTTTNNCGQVRGPVQLSFSKSIDPIFPQEISITRMAVETAKEAEKQDGGNRTMGRKFLVPYALYRLDGYVSAPFAQQTGFSDEDLEMLWTSLVNMFDQDHSASRGKMSARKLVVFRHDCKLGNAPAQKLFDLISVNKKADCEGPARAFADYAIEVDAAQVPQGVELLEKL